MSDNLFDSLGSDDLFEEEAEKKPEGEGQNKTFIIAVAALGGLLVITLILFGVWAFVINPRMQANVQPTETIGIVEETPEDIDGGDESMGVSDEQVDEGVDESMIVSEEKPTNTPEPTPTPVVGPTRTPTPQVDAATGGESDSENTDPTPTTVPRRTPTPSPTRQLVATPQATPRPPAGSAAESLSQTGLGEVLMVVGAIALIGLAFFARRLRNV